MNKEIIKSLIPEIVHNVESLICPFCKEEINIDNFRDNLSLKEYQISGLCQKCQDEVFGI